MIALPHDPASPTGIWTPRPFQLPVWNYLDAGGKRAVEVWHRRAGKDEFCLAWAAYAAHKRVGSYWHMLPQASQARKAIWDAIDEERGIRRIDLAFPLELRESTRNSDMFIRFKNGSSWAVVGSDNYNSLVGSQPVGLTFSEFALANPQAWAYLRPILRKNGGWALFISTTRGKNHLYRLAQHARESDDWHYSLLEATKSGVFTAADLRDELLENKRQFGPVLGQALFEQEYLCSWSAATPGAFWAREMATAEKEGRITHVDHDPALPVVTSWDLGVKDSTVIHFWQVVGTRIHAIRSLAYQNTGLDEMIRDVLRLPYTYREHIAPHDIEVREIGAPGAQSRNTTARGLGIQFRIAPKMSVQEGIDAFRRLIPRMWFSKDHCETAIEAFGLYRAEFDDMRGVLSRTPIHDWTSDYADSARYFAVTRLRTNDWGSRIDYSRTNRAAT